MIALIASMLRARAAQAVTVLLLSVFATAAAVAGPASLRAVDSAIVEHEVATADRAEQVVSLTGLTSGNGQSTDFESLGDTALSGLADFELIYANEAPVMAFGEELSRLVFREGACDHLVITTGRCLMGMYEVVLAEEVAAHEGLRAGDAIAVRQARYDEVLRSFVPAGPPAYMSVVGLYRPRDPGEAYWGTLTYFPVTADGTRTGPVFTGRRTLDLLGYPAHQLAMEAVPRPGAITIERVAQLRTQVEVMTSRLEEGSGQSALGVRTELPNLLNRIERSRQLSHELIPVAFVPLVALCWFVIFLAVGYGVFARRHELGLVTLRGVARTRRWWLATGESLVVIVAGAPLGYLLGYLAVRLVATTRLGDPGGPNLTAAALPYAAVALLGALAAALLAQRRELTAPVVDLLRRVPRRLGASRAALFEGVIVLLAVVAVAQLNGQEGELTGIALLVPGLVIAAVAVIAARAVVPLAGAFTRYALRRGMLGSALAAAQLARRPGSQRLFVLLTAAVGLLGFVVATSDVSTRARADRAEIATGAPAVVSVDTVDARKLLSVVRTVDPPGAWAMAVAQPSVRLSADGAPVLAVDSSRLAAAAAWRQDFGIAAAELSRLLRPPAAESFVLTGESLTLEVENQAEDGAPPLSLTLLLAPTSGGPQVPVQIDPLEPGRRIYQRLVAECTRGCRVVGVEIAGSVDAASSVLLHQLRQISPEPAVVITPADFADETVWRALAGSRLDGLSDGGLVTVVDNGFGERNGIMVLDAPSVLPVASPSRKGTFKLASLDGSIVDAQTVATPAMLPRLGRVGSFVDLEYADRMSATSAPLRGAEVWLGAAAPPDAAERLRAAGLPVLGVRYATAARSDLDREGPALALWFHLVAALFALVLAVGGIGLVAAVDRGRRAEDLGALRRQGLKRRHVRRAALWGHLVVVLAGIVVGPLAAAAAWWLAGGRMPVFVDSLFAVRPPRWPDPQALWPPWAVAAGAFGVAAILAALDLRRAVARD